MDFRCRLGIERTEKGELLQEPSETSNADAGK